MFEDDPPSLRLDRLFNHLIGWACVALGLIIIAAIVLTPPWIDLQQAKWEKGFIEQCVRSQSDKVTAYEEFAAALQSNDPVLLERLAFHHLRLKPKNVTVVSFDEDDRVVGPYLAFDDKIEFAGRTWTERITHPGRVDRSLLEQWLHKPMPVVGVDYPTFTKPQNTLVRLATGPRRWLLLGVGGMLLFGGLMFPGPRQDEDDSDEEEQVERPAPRAENERKKPYSPRLAGGSSMACEAEPGTSAGLCAEAAEPVQVEHEEDDEVIAELDDVPAGIAGEEEAISSRATTEAGAASHGPG